MVTIYKITTGETHKLYNADKECSNVDSVCTNTRVGTRFRQNWHGVFDYYIDCGSFTQLLLTDNFRVKGIDKEEEKRNQELFGWTW